MINRILPLDTVTACANTGEWLDKPRFTGLHVAETDWNSKTDTDTMHFDTYENFEGKTRAIEVTWILENAHD